MPNKFNPEIVPAWHAIKFDETQFYDKQFLERYKIGKIYGVYLTDFSTSVYCCEITPSYELNFIHSIYEGGPDDEEAVDALMSALEECDRYTEPVAYMHCSVIDRLPDDCKHPIDVDEDDWQKDPDRNDRGFDAVHEIYTSNPVW